MTKAILVALCATLASTTSGDPFVQVTTNQRALLQPAIARWTSDQVKHNWSDLWEITDQTSEMKNELLLDRTSPDMTKNEFVHAMRYTMDSGYPIIHEFTLIKVVSEPEGFEVTGCGKKTREEWHQTSLTTVHVRLVNGKPRFGLHSGASSEPCTL